jgi:O-antigen/teichoic acid export membrane protein
MQIAQTISNMFSSRAGQSLFLMGIRSISLVTKFAATLFIAKFLNLEALGVFGLVTAATMTVPTITGFSLMYSLSRKAVTQETEEIERNLRNYLHYTMAIYGIIFIVGALVLSTSDTFILAAVIGVLILFEHLNQDFYTFFLNQSRPIVANIFHAMRSSLWMIVFMVMAYIWPSMRTIEVLLGFWLAGCGAAALSSLIVLKAWRWFRGSHDPFFKWVRREFRDAHVLYWNALMFTGYLYVDRYVIGITLGLELTGVYVFFWQISSALLNLLNTGVIQVMRPTFVASYRNGDDRYSSIYNACRRNTLLWSLLLSVVSGVVIYYLLPYLEKPLISSWLPLLPVMLVGLLFVAQHQVQGLVFYSQHQEIMTLRIDMVLMPIMLTLYFILIPLFGLWGAGACLIIFAVTKFFVQEHYTKALLGRQKNETNVR